MDCRSRSPSVPSQHTTVCPRCCIASRPIWRVRQCLRYHVEALRRIHEPNGHDTSDSLELIWTPFGPQLSQPKRARSSRECVPAMLPRLQIQITCASLCLKDHVAALRRIHEPNGHDTSASLELIWTPFGLQIAQPERALTPKQRSARDAASPQGPYGVCVRV